MSWESCIKTAVSVSSIILNWLNNTWLSSLFRNLDFSTDPVSTASWLYSCVGTMRCGQADSINRRHSAMFNSPRCVCFYWESFESFAVEKRPPGENYQLFLLQFLFCCPCLSSSWTEANILIQVNTEKRNRRSNEHLQTNIRRLSTLFDRKYPNHLIIWKPPHWW